MDRAAVATAMFARLDRACMDQQRRDQAFDPPLKRIARLEAVAPLMMDMARQAIRSTIAGQAAAQIERAKQVAADDRQRKADYGTLARRRRGELVQEDRADIDSTSEYKPTIRGARRYDPLREFLGIRNAHRPHDGASHDDARRWVAAQAYRALVEVAGGARLGGGQVEKVDGTASVDGYSNRMLDAIGAVRCAKAAMGAHYPAVRWTVEEYAGVDEFAVVAGVDSTDAKARLTAGLDALVDYLGGMAVVGAE